MENQPDLNVPSITQEPIHLSVERIQGAVYILSLALVVLAVLFAEAACMFRRVCFTTEDIDIPPYMSFMFIPALFVALVFTYFSFEASNYFLKGSVDALKIIDIVWGILIIGGGVAALVAGIAQVEDDQLQKKWDELTPLAQEYYDEDKDKLVEDFRINISLVCITQIITGLILLAIGATLAILSKKAPQNYLPRTTSQRKLLQPNVQSNPADSQPLQAPPQAGMVEMRRLPPRRSEPGDLGQQPFDEEGRPYFGPHLQEEPARPALQDYQSRLSPPEDARRRVSFQADEQGRLGPQQPYDYQGQ
jgi:hypothetical protein